MLLTDVALHFVTLCAQNARSAIRSAEIQIAQMAGLAIFYPLITGDTIKPSLRWMTRWV
ncbi:hypothetical protein [Scytonema sp. HK-05]|uniref:hypothetical protein n=1 Tax=Scytonema sp. HK-05 TaxID=1137095 RepID=UPI001E4F1807|nr:hypothetical protein [Scytonema sp. HK-05]